MNGQTDKETRLFPSVRPFLRSFVCLYRLWPWERPSYGRTNNRNL